MSRLHDPPPTRATRAALRRAVLLGAALLGGAWLAGCGRSGAGQVSADDRPASRIVTIAPNADEILCALGAADRIVGVSRFTLYPPELSDRPRVGGLYDPDLERILTLNPDLVILRGRNEQVERLCARHGIRLYLDPTENLADLERNIAELGRRVGRTRQAGELVEAMHRELQAVRDEARRRRGQAPPPRVLLTTARHPSELKDVLTTGKGTLHDELIALAGGENVFGQLDIQYPQVALEDILARRPDVIIELMPETQVTPDLRRQILEAWRQAGPIPAVRSGRIHILGNEAAYAGSLVPSLRAASLARVFLDLLHPDERDMQRAAP